MTDYLVIFVT